jgi:AraC-like DNA-binding protein
MLKEKIVFSEDLPVVAIIANIEEYPIHFHDEMEIVYVLSGTIGLKNGYYNYVLSPGDIFILNDREIHSFQNTGEKNLVLMLQIDLKFFSKYFNNLNNCFFVTDMKDSDDESLDNLRTLLSRIVFEFLSKEKDFEHRTIEHTCNFISSLVNEFQYFSMDDGKFVNESKNKGNKVLAERLKRITEYMYENHSRKLTLNEIADREHLSVFYLSHVIKAATGLSYQDLLSFMRVEESEKLLLGTEKKIGAISVESGFSAVRYYIKYFEKWFGIHPLEYRKQFTGKVRSREIHAIYTLATTEEIIPILRKQIKEVYSAFEKETSPALDIIELDLKNLDIDKKTRGIKINLIPKCTMETLTKYSEEIMAALRDLRIKELNIYSYPENINISSIEKLLDSGIKVVLSLIDSQKQGTNINKITKEGINKIKRKLEHRTQIFLKTVDDKEWIEKINYMWDSSIMIPYLIEKAIAEKGEIRDFNSIVDDTDELIEIKGKLGLMTSGLTAKPAYYAYKMMSDLDGTIISVGKNHIISLDSKGKDKFESIRILVFNTDERVSGMVDGYYPVEEVMQAVYQFKKSTEIIFKLSGISGNFRVKRYKFGKENSILSFMEKLDFPSNLSVSEEQLFAWGSCPNVDFSVQNATDSINIQSYLTGFSAEMIMIDR